MVKKKNKTRFAPSPTGSLHIGGLRTAVYSYALAKHSNGDFVLRIEDTDKKREVPEGAEKIQVILKQFGITWDEYYVQSELAKDGRYEEAASKLVKEGKAFYCQCKPKNAKKEGYSKELRDPCRDKNLKSGAVKLKVPENEMIEFRDFVLEKDVSWETSRVADATLLKSDGFPTYHLAVVVDDHKMEISHVLRGHDWMPSTPIHLLVYKYLSYELPEIGHLTDILDPEGGKLSKRKGSTSCEGLLNEGYLPEALLNFVILLGWSPKDNRELFSLDDFVKFFDPKGFQKSNPVFDKSKLDWFNGYYIRQKSDSQLNEMLLPFTPKDVNKDMMMKIVPLIKERIKTLKDFETLADFFFERPEVSKGMLGEKWKYHLRKAFGVIENLEPWTLENLNNSLMKEIDKESFKVGNFFMDLRVAITGSKFTPPINDSILILGKKEVSERIKSVLDSED